MITLAHAQYKQAAATEGRKTAEVLASAGYLQVLRSCVKQVAAKLYACFKQSCIVIFGSNNTKTVSMKQR